MYKSGWKGQNSQLLKFSCYNHVIPIKNYKNYLKNMEYGYLKYNNNYNKQRK